MKNTFFIAGTDTEVGKTYVTCGFLQAAKQQGLTTAVFKPIASGAEHGRNGDALLLQQNSDLPLSYQQLNPFCFAPAIAPHIAAAEVGVELSVAALVQRSQFATAADITFIEGAGGWLCPLNNTETLADFVGYYRWPVILVVGMRLGCLNHTLLTIRSISEQKIPLAGWVANFLDPAMQEKQKNFLTLKQWISAPCLGRIEYQQPAACCLNLGKIAMCYTEIN